MKLVVAVIEPEMLPDVKQSLFEANIYKMTVTNALSEGEDEDYSRTFRGVRHEVTLHKRVRIEILVNEDIVEPAISAILKGTRDNNSKGGKIYVLDVNEFVHISTGKRGPAAI